MILINAKKRSTDSVALLLCPLQDIVIFVRAGEDGVGVGTDRHYPAAIGAGEVHRRQYHLTGDAFALIAVKDLRVVNNHPLRRRALVSHLSNLRAVNPRLENATAGSF